MWTDSDNYIRLERTAGLRKGKVGTFVNFEEREGGHRGAVHNGGLPAGTAFLRLARKGGRITASTSPDGKAWTPLKPIDTAWPAKLKVGVEAVNNNSEPFSVRFEGFSLKTGSAH